MVPIRQKFQSRALPDLAGEVIREVGKLLDLAAPKPGSRIAITAGSRGIANYDIILKVILRELERRQHRPFLVAAMGSHGGGTAEGKLRVLADAGITEQEMCAPIRATTQVVRIGETGDGAPLLLDEEAARADSILLLNRIHPHSCFEGPIQSGLVKMMCVGLGNVTGAQVTHRTAIRDGLFPTIRSRGRKSIELAPVLGGVGVIENETGETAAVEAMSRNDLERSEEALLWKSRRMRPRIPFSYLHLLIVDRIGKNISGTGMDPKVVGRLQVRGTEPSGPRIDRIYARELTGASHGNAHGVGIADFVAHRLAEKIDWKATRANSLAAGAPHRCRLPLVMPTDRDAVEAAFVCCGPIGPEGPRVVRIDDTGSLQQMWVSEALLEEGGAKAGWSVIGDPVPMEFDTDGMLA
jgi:hypothetical protein